MKNLEKDEMIKKLADFVGVDLSTLKILDKTEEKAISLAHEIAGDSYDDIEHFFEQIRMPEFIDPEFVFKALKYNSSFYNQNISLIRNSEDSRQKVYEKAKVTAKEKNTELETEYGIIDSIQDLKKIVTEMIKKDITNFKESIQNGANTFFRQFTIPEISNSVLKSLPLSVAAASGDNTTIPYDKEMSNDPIQIDTKKSYMEFLPDGIRLAFEASFNKDKNYYAVILGKNTFVFALIKDNVAIIETKDSDNFRSGKVVFIYSEKAK